MGWDVRDVKGKDENARHGKILVQIYSKIFWHCFEL